MLAIGDTIKQKGKKNPETFFIHKTLIVFEFENKRRRYWAANIDRTKVFDYAQVRVCSKLLTEKNIFLNE